MIEPTHRCMTDFTRTLAVIGAFLYAVSASGQSTHIDHAVEMIEQTPPERLPPPRPLAGIGNAHIDITAKPKALRWFHQGLNLYHDFWEYESARAFQQCIRVDPNCAMCYWGLYEALSFVHSNAQGYAAPALAKAVSLQDRVSEREQLYIQATKAAPFRRISVRRRVAWYPATPNV